MLAAIADAKSAKNDSTGHVKRLDEINLGLEQGMVEVLDSLLPAANDDAKLQDEMRHALKALLKGGGGRKDL